jgi:predicted hotdog family 3-hydroxylacyl-ACP dehydratase
MLPIQQRRVTMPEPFMKELSTLFPGKGTPDPAFLLNLVPLLPDRLLPRAIQVALGIRYPALDLRAHIVEMLATRLKPEDKALQEKTLVAARAFMLSTRETEEPIEAALLRILAPVLPPPLLPQALELAIRIVDFDARLDVLASLAKRLPPADREAVLRKALEAVQAIEIEGERASALKVLIRHLPQSLLEDAMTVVKSIRSPDSQAEVLRAQAQSLPGKKHVARLNDALATIRTIKDPESRGWAVAQLAPSLSKEQLKQALGVARRIRDLEARVHTLTAIAPHLAKAERSCALDEVLAHAKKIKWRDARAQALAQLAPQLPKRERGAVLAKILPYAREMQAKEEKVRAPKGFVDLSGDRWNSWKYAEARALGLAELASRLPEEERAPLLDEAVAAAWLSPDAWSRSKVLTELGPILPESLLREVQETERKIRFEEEKEILDSAVRDLSRDPLKVFLFAELIQRFPEQGRPTHLKKALKAARSIHPESSQARAFITLAKLLPEEKRSAVLAKASTLARSIKNPRERAILSAALIPLLPESQKGQHLRESLDIMRSTKQQDSQVEILKKLIPVLPRTSLGQALEVLKSIENQLVRAELLKELIPYLPPSEAAGAFSELLAAARSTQDEYQRALQLEGLAPYLPRPLLQKALEIARSIHKRDERANALSAVLASLARQASESEREEILCEAFNEAFFTSRPRGGRAGRAMPLGIEATGERARSLLTRLPEADKDALLEEWLGPIEKSPHVDFQESMKSAEPLRPPQERVVNTGFAPLGQADQSIDKRMPLASGQRYYFWLDVGELDPNSIENIPTPIPIEHLPSEALLRVAIFGLKDEIEITPEADVGELQLLPDGTARVVRQPLQQSNPPLLSNLLTKRLFFPVTVPGKPGTFRLRCNIYFEQILIQSRLIHAQVMDKPQPTEEALRSVVDYTLSHTFWPAHLNRLDSHRLSLMLNTNGDKTHILIFGQKDGSLFKNEAVLSATELKKPIENARKALCKVSWGDNNSWTGLPKQQYLYRDQKFDLDRLREDVTNLAIGGYILYNALIDKLSGGRKRADELAGLMRHSGLVQIAMRQSPSHVLPAALFYDYPLDTQANHKLCETFTSSLQGKEPLEKSACFSGACPSHNQLDHICPSGFWGYRHLLGMPVSVVDGTDVPPEIILKGKAEIVAGVATNLNQLNEHMQKLQTLHSNLGWHYSDNRAKILELLKTTKAHIIYFYCHGGLANNVPYLQVGSGNDYIEGSNLRAYGISWDNPRPLVFINGCHTTALDPEQAINLVQDFVNTGGAGVIGTEITIFEPLACGFAEECLRLFLSGNSSIGEAVRSARLKLLKEGNPLGLVYTPFVIPSLRLKDFHAK